MELPGQNAQSPKVVRPQRLMLLLGVMLASFPVVGLFVSYSAAAEATATSACKGTDLGCENGQKPAALSSSEGVQHASTTAEKGDGIVPASALGPPKNPIFMLPGIAGSGLLLSANNALLPFCSSQPVNYPVPFRLWASLSLVVPPRSHQLCWLDIMQPTVDEAGENYASKAGLNIEVDGYGTAHGFDYLDYYYYDRYGVPGTAYFHRMLLSFYSMGYKEGDSLVGIPYDWRLPPWQVDFTRFKGEIEAHVAAMGGAKADVLVHSLGSIVCNYFFNKVVNQEWKDKHINSYTLVAPATGGSFKAIKALLTGYNDPVDLSFWNFLDVSLIPVDVLRDLSRSMGSIYALLPDADLYGKDHLVVRQLLPKSGSSLAAASIRADEPQTAAEGGARIFEFRRLQGEEGEEMGAGYDRQLEEDQSSDRRMRQRVQQVQQYHAGEQLRKAEVERLAAVEDVEEVIYTLGNWTTLLDPELRTRAAAAAERMQGVLKDPGVPTRCIWSAFFFPSTDVGYIYTGTDFSHKPIAILDVGDDTVPLRSLSVCTGWASTFEVKTFKNLDHMFIFGDGEFNNYIRLSFNSTQTHAD